MAEFWEEAFREKQEMWGTGFSESALITAELFGSKVVKKVLIPGIGYGRNAQPFLSRGMDITGIEISKTAIQLAEKHYGPAMKIYNGNVTDMPFGNDRYEGIFSHALVHLLSKYERDIFIKSCYNQLSADGYMVFSAISKKAMTYGQGIFINKDRYEQSGGVEIFFYDQASIHAEFGKYGLYEVTEVMENHAMFLIKCHKNED